MLTEEQNQSLASIALENGGEFPYDAPDSWWNDAEDGNDPPAPRDMAHAAARGIIADLKDRRGIKTEFNGVDEDIRKEIVERMAEIIRQAMAKQ